MKQQTQTPPSYSSGIQSSLSKEDEKVVAALIDKGWVYYAKENYKEALSCFREAKKKKSPRAWHALARMYEQGLGVDKNIQEANRLYALILAAANQGDACAQHVLSCMYRVGHDGVDKNETEALKWCRLAAKQGYPEAQGDLGAMYAEGVGVTKNYIKALKWCQLAVDQENVEGQRCLGIMYLAGWGVAQDEKKAQKYLELAANQGDSVACLYLGYLYADQCGKLHDDKKAYDYYQRAANRGFMLTQYQLDMVYEQLGIMCEQGRGVERDYVKACEWYQRAADQGHTEARYNLNDIHRLGLNTSQENEFKDDEKSLTVLVNKGWQYQKEGNYKIAMACFQIAANKKQPAGWYALARMYGGDCGIVANQEEASKFYALVMAAADQGSALAQYYLGEMYTDGFGVKLDKQTAHEYYQRAADQGCVTAQYKLGLKCADYKKSCEWFQRAADQGDKQAQSSLAYKYSVGTGVPKDIEKANELHCRADNQTHRNRQHEKKILAHYQSAIEQTILEIQVSLVDVATPADSLVAKARENHRQGNYKEALECLKKAATQQSPRVWSLLASMYEKGEGTEKDLQEAFKYYHLAAEKGHVNAQFKLGWMYYNGRGILQNYQEAFKWFNLAAEKGDASAQLSLGHMYHNGDGVSTNYQEAVKWYSLAAEKGNADAQYNFGYMYLNGKGVSKNFQEAFKWFTLAAEKGNADAQLGLGAMYYDGEGVSKDFQEAFKWFILTAEKGDFLGQFFLGAIYYNGHGFSKDYQEAFKWYHLAAEQGYIDAQFSLGQMCYYGEGVSKNFQEAFKWFTLAAEKGNASAQFSLGRMYHNGEGVHKNFQEAFKWLTLAAEKGDVDAQFNLGAMYLNGEGVSKNFQEAFKWFTLAAEQGNTEAQAGLEQMRREEHDISTEYPKGITCEQQGSEKKEYTTTVKEAPKTTSTVFPKHILTPTVRKIEVPLTGKEVIAQRHTTTLPAQHSAAASLQQGPHLQPRHKDNHDIAKTITSKQSLANEKNIISAVKDTPQTTTAMPSIPILMPPVTTVEKSVNKDKTAVQHPSVMLPSQPSPSVPKPISRLQRPLPLPPSSSEAAHTPKPATHEIAQKIRIPAGTMQLREKSQNTNVVLPYSEIETAKVLGKGGFGIVYKGTWNYTPVAVKKLHKKDLDKDVKLEFEHEASVMLELRHPNILALYGITLQPEYCMVMEFMEGGSLYAVLQSTKVLKWPLRYKIAMDAAKGLAYLHGRAQPILHRDLKSLNILLDRLHRAKLADFGLSRIKRSGDASTVGKAGTLAWIAPELLANTDKAEFTAACDIYSLGVVFWELLTRQTPYRAAYKGQREEMPQNVPEVFAELTKRCWAENPLDRPTAPDVCEFILKNPIASQGERALSPRSTGKGRVILLPSSSSSSQSMSEDVAVTSLDQSNASQANSKVQVVPAPNPTGPGFFSRRGGTAVQRAAQNIERALPKPPSAVSTNQSQQSNGASFGSLQFSGVSAGNKPKSIGEFEFSGIYSSKTPSTSTVTDSTTEKVELRAQVQHQFLAQRAEDLTVEKGAIVHVLKQEGAWWHCEYNGKTGIVPGNYLKIITGVVEERKDTSLKSSYGRI